MQQEHQNEVNYDRKINQTRIKTKNGIHSRDIWKKWHTGLVLMESYSL